jgi:hypothetical protein
MYRRGQPLTAACSAGVQSTPQFREANTKLAEEKVKEFVFVVRLQGSRPISSRWNYILLKNKSEREQQERRRYVVFVLVALTSC